MFNFDNCFAVDDLGSKIKGYAKYNENSIKLIIPKENVNKKAHTLTAFQEVFSAMVGDDGFYLGSNDFGRYSGFKTYFSKREDFDSVVGINLVNMFGVKIGETAYTAIVVGMPYVYRLRISKCADKYSLGLCYDLNRYDIDEDICIELYLMQKSDDYIQMAKLFRRYQLDNGNCELLENRIGKNEILNYITESVEVRIRMGWKKCPPDVLEQTVENEPEMKVACTFDRVIDIINEMKRQGIEKAQICLVGWNKSGHDGRWPTAFPVEEKLGGETALKRLILHARNCGYKIVGHTNSTDCYSISELFDNGRITIKDKNGLPIKNRAPYSGGNMYWLCPKEALEISKNMFSKMSELGFSGMHYIDVISIQQPRQCFDDEHPSKVRETINILNEILSDAKQKIGAVSSEGGFDYCFKNLDFALYVCYNRPKEVYMDEGVPLWEMVYHGIIMENPGKITINYPLYDRENTLNMIEMCGRPTFYYYSKFTSRGEWDGDDIFIADKDEDIKKSVSAIKSASDDYSQYCRLQTEEIIDYKKLNGDLVTEVVYSDGTKVFVNYSDEEYVYKNEFVIKAKDFFILGAKNI